MAYLNQVQIIGNLGRDPEMKYTPQGNAVVSFSVAVTRTYGEDKKPDTEWFNIVAWNKLAELCNQYLAKGRKVYVEGRLQTRSWDGQDGVKKYRTELVANNVLFLDRAPKDDTDESLDAGDTYGDL